MSKRIRTGSRDGAARKGPRLSAYYHRWFRDLCRLLPRVAAKAMKKGPHYYGESAYGFLRAHEGEVARLFGRASMGSRPGVFGRRVFFGHPSSRTAAKRLAPLFQAWNRALA